MARLRKVEGMIGKKYGRVLVLGILPERAKNSARHVLVWGRCECGEIVNAAAYGLRNGTQLGCRKCGHQSSALKQSLKLPNGECLVEVAARTGIKRDTLNQRVLRGWKMKDLLRPPVPKGLDRWGRSAFR